MATPIFTGARPWVQDGTWIYSVPDREERNRVNAGRAPHNRDSLPPVATAIVGGYPNGHELIALIVEAVNSHAQLTQDRADLVEALTGSQAVIAPAMNKCIGRGNAALLSELQTVYASNRTLLSRIAGDDTTEEDGNG
jgi:hypothetical protein